VLDPNDAANFKQDGTQPVTPGSLVRFDDESVSDYAARFANEQDAGACNDLDVIATFLRAAFRDGSPVPTPTQTEAVIEHGKTVYVTRNQKILPDRLELYALCAARGVQCQAIRPA